MPPLSHAAWQLATPSVGGASQRGVPTGGGLPWQGWVAESGSVPRRGIAYLRSKKKQHAAA